MDLIILLAIIAIVVIMFGKFKNFVYTVVFIDIFLRILAYVKVELNIADLTKFLDKHFPDSIPDIISNYSSGIITDFVMWFYVAIFIVFEYLTITNLIKDSR